MRLEENRFFCDKKYLLFLVKLQNAVDFLLVINVLDSVVRGCKYKECNLVVN